MRVEDARAFLAPLSSHELTLDEEQLERLDLLGLRTLGAVAALGQRELESLRPVHIPPARDASQARALASFGK